MGDFIPPLGDKHQSSQAAFAATASHLGEILHGHSIATRA
jgi:hypothetical protein